MTFLFLFFIFFLRETCYFVPQICPLLDTGSSWHQVRSPKTVNRWGKVRREVAPKFAVLPPNLILHEYEPVRRYATGSSQDLVFSLTEMAVYDENGMCRVAA